MRTADRLDVYSEVGKDGSFQFWTPCRTGKLPRQGKCDGPEFDKSLTFTIPPQYSARKEVEKRLGSQAWYRYGRQEHTAMQKAYLVAINRIFKKHGFKGKVTAVGVARRPSKKAWEFSLTGAKFTINQNFVLAKLMDQADFEKEIWDRAVKIAFPNKRFKID